MTIFPNLNFLSFSYNREYLLAEENVPRSFQKNCITFPSGEKNEGLIL